MTKVIVLGEESPKEKKRIELIKYLDGDNEWRDAEFAADHWDVIEVIIPKYQNGYSLMFCYCQRRTLGTLYLGHFNDGVV